MPQKAAEVRQRLLTCGCCSSLLPTMLFSFFDRSGSWTAADLSQLKGPQLRLFIISLLTTLWSALNSPSCCTMDVQETTQLQQLPPHFDVPSSAPLPWWEERADTSKRLQSGMEPHLVAHHAVERFEPSPRLCAVDHVVVQQGGDVDHLCNLGNALLPPARVRWVAAVRRLIHRQHGGRGGCRGEGGRQKQQHCGAQALPLSSQLQGRWQRSDIQGEVNERGWRVKLAGTAVACWDLDPAGRARVRACLVVEPVGSWTVSHWGCP